jgi:hypothetical protein
MTYDTGKGTSQFQDFFTKPSDASDAFARISDILPNKDVLTVLEPTVGTGNIAFQALALPRKVEVHAYEIQEEYARTYLERAEEKGYFTDAQESGLIIVRNFMKQ